MVWNLPPLPALRVFEAAARLGNFTRAGEELGMTQAAVSYQIKVLEERVGSPLFIRTARKVVLTATGEALARSATQAFALLSESFEASRQDASAHLSITTIQTFASNWLSERIGAFQRSHPNLVVNMDTSSRVIDITRGDFDLAIRTGRGEWPGLTAHFLFSGNYAPMLSPRLAESIGGINDPADLYRLPLLGHTDPWWRNWFEAAGAVFQPERVIPGPTLGVQFYEAVSAIAGQGVAILTKTLYGAHLADGRLIQPFDVEGSDGHGYWLAYPEARRNVPKIREFRDWLLSETRSLREK